MTSIVLDKTWSVINAVVDTNTYSTLADQSKWCMYYLKEAFKTAGWVVTQYSDSVNIRTDETTYPMTYDKFVWAIAGSIHSWFVVKNTTLGTDFSVCIDCNFGATGSYQVTVLSTFAGYQAGTITNRPVVNTSGVEHNFGTIIYSYSAALANRKGWAILYSSDGECFRAFSSYGDGKNAASNTGGCVLCFEKLKNHVSWLTNNVVSIVKTGGANTTSGFKYTVMCVTTSTSTRVEVNSTAVNVGIGTIGIGDPLGNSSVGVGTDVSGAFMLTPCYAISLNTSYPGILGSFYDMYFASSDIPEGVYFKTSSSSKGLVKFGHGAFGCSGNNISIP